MELTKDIWTNKDIELFQQYLKTFENIEKKEWGTNILQTKLEVLSMKTIDIKNIVNGIYNGNYLSFLDFMEWYYYENTAINGMLINKIDDFNLKKKYLDIYSKKIDNWATCDLLTFNIKGNEEEYFNLANNYIDSDLPFVRRVGILILFNFIDKKEYVDKIYPILDKFTNEEHYYVNMINAWLLSELFIKQKDKTIKYLSNNKLNKFTINKGIQKCRDSHRVSAIDKEMLLKYKVK